MTTLKNHTILDDEEEALMVSLEKGEWKESNDTKLIEDIRSSAREFRMRKPITLRLQGSLLNELRILAEREGMPYQTYIQSTLYKHTQNQQSFKKETSSLK